MSLRWLSTMALLATLSLPSAAWSGSARPKGGDPLASARSLLQRTDSQLSSYPTGALREALLRARAWLQRATKSGKKQPKLARRLVERAKTQLQLAATLRELARLDDQLARLSKQLARLRSANDRRAKKLEEQEGRLELLRTIQK